MKVTLTKLETLENADFPQEDKYPSKTTVKEGFIDEENMPQIGKTFYMEIDKGIFHTSTIKDIEELDDHTMILTTLNSKYRLNYYEDLGN
jgi:hypothetical protein